jgi:hypothetical protein
MAAPHISGAISLLWSAIPALRRNIKSTLEILEKTALHQESTQCRSPNKTPNHGKSHFLIILVYGFGTVDVLKAYELALKLNK